MAPDVERGNFGIRLARLRAHASQRAAGKGLECDFLARAAPLVQGLHQPRWRARQRQAATGRLARAARSSSRLSGMPQRPMSAAVSRNDGDWAGATTTPARNRR